MQRITRSNDFLQLNTENIILKNGDRELIYFGTISNNDDTYLNSRHINPAWMWIPQRSWNGHGPIKKYIPQLNEAAKLLSEKGLLQLEEEDDVITRAGKLFKSRRISSE